VPPVAVLRHGDAAGAVGLAAGAVAAAGAATRDRRLCYHRPKMTHLNCRRRVVNISPMVNTGCA
jgi:hypothetical protein